MIIIGSKALLPHLAETVENVERYEKSDYDVIMTIEEFQEWSAKCDRVIKMLKPTHENKYRAVLELSGERKVYEIELALPHTSARLLASSIDAVTDNEATFGWLGEDMYSLRLEYQLLTKRSHLIYPVHFEKNIMDYHILKEILGGFERDELMNEYFRLRKEEAKNRYNQKTPRLNVSNEDFFSSKLAVERYFVHDDIHAVMAHHDKPVYEMMKREDNMDSAWCEKDMFFALPYEYQIQAVQEEAYVIALERYIIPHSYDWEDHFKCYQKAVRRICTTLCSGWFRTFAIENYPEVMRKYNHDFVEIFKDAYVSGRIKLVEDKTKSDLPELRTRKETFFS